MQLSDGEKLILVMLSEIYKKLDIKNTNVDAEVVLDSIFHDQTWGLQWEYGSNFGCQSSDPPVVTETVDILAMNRTIEDSFNALAPADQDKVRNESQPFEDFVSFRGFDGNHDPHVGVVRYLVDTLGRFSELEGRNINSHSQSTLPKYKKMLRVYEGILPTISHRPLSADQLVQILKA